MESILNVQKLIKAILTTWAANTGVGQPLNGILGPFWDVAPEKQALVDSSVPLGYPRCIISQLPAGKIVWGFGGGIYPEPVTIEFKVFASEAGATVTGGLVQAAGLADAIASVYDNNRMSLASPEICKIALRVSAPMMKKEPTWGETGLAVYSGTLIYNYQVQRTV